MKDVILIAQLARGDFLLHGLHLGRGAVLIRAAYIAYLTAHAALIASEHVCREHTSDDVAEMRYVVDVGKR